MLSVLILLPQNARIQLTKFMENRDTPIKSDFWGQKVLTIPKKEFFKAELEANVIGGLMLVSQLAFIYSLIMLKIQLNKIS